MHLLFRCFALPCNLIGTADKEEKATSGAGELSVRAHLLITVVCVQEACPRGLH